jgi:hypothetical protein
MPINLNALGLIPSTPYNVSITMKVGDKEIDSLRSFSATTPPIFNKNLKDYAPSSAVITKTYVRTRNAVAGGKISETTAIKIDSCRASITATTVQGTAPISSKYRWKGGGQHNPPMVQIQFNLNKKITDAVISGIDAKKDKFQYILNFLARGKDSDNNGVVTVKVSALELGSQWLQTGTVEGKTWYKGLRGSKIMGDRFEKDYSGTAVATQDITVQPVSGTKSLTSKLRAYVDPAIVASLVNDENIKDVVYFLYSDSAASAPPESSYIYLNSNFDAASGNDVGSQGWTKASGDPFMTNNRYNFPQYTNADISSRNVISQSIIDTIVFSNASQNSGLGEVDDTESYPNNVRIAFTVVRYIKNGDSWDQSWVGGETKMSSPISAVIA